MKQILTLTLCWLMAGLLSAQKTIGLNDPPQAYPPMVSQGQYLGHIRPLRELSTIPSKETEKEEMGIKRNHFFANALNNPNPLPTNGDPLAKKQSHDRGGPEIIPGNIFDGIQGDGNVSPPDPTGDIGKNHYVQMTNASGGALLQAWDKVTGNSVLGPIPSSNIWSEVGSGSIGDPIVQYDHDANRWLIMEIADFFTNELLLAISDSDDPTGGWKAYRFQTVGFGDYPKLYVWPNAYFITVNEISGTNQCSGYALERSAILAGEPAFDLYRFVMPNYNAIAYQPATGADWEGPTPPPAGSPGYIFRVYDDSWDGGQDHIQIWKVNVDWNDPSQSSLVGPDKVFPTPFETRVCFGGGLFDCIEQPDNAVRITALENIIMYRAPYRNFGNYESVVFNHVTDVSGQVGEGGDAEVRWYELRKQGGGNWQIFQEGTYAPDVVTNRFMGTLCTDEAGNIALGYSGASEFKYPGLYITGRRTSDPPGDMTIQEFTLAEGQQSHQNDNRWGDYSNMAVDPEDGRTFWFTGEYQPAGLNWGTKIGSFKIQRDSFDVSPKTLVTPVNSSLLTNSEVVKVSLYNGGINPAAGFSASLYLDGNLITTENVPLVIPSETYADFTFATPVDLSIVGKSYHFKIITHWAPDQFTRNDTLETTVQKLTSNDVAAVGKYNLSGLVCGSETDFGIIFRNASGLPMTSAKIHWRLNNQAYNIYNWTGNLGPGERDTIDLHATGILNGLNGLRIYTTEPNGTQDERTSNDTLAPIKFFGNLDGTYLTAEAHTDFGVLAWELRSLTNQVLSSGELSEGQTYTQICSDDDQCYILTLHSTTFNWHGDFKLYDIFGNVLVHANDATQDVSQYNICTPARKQKDVGAFALIAPVSSANLGAAEPVKMSLRNFGLTNLNNIQVAYRLNGGTWNTETHAGLITAGATVEHTFATTEDLSQVGGNYQFELSATIAGDEQTDNDTIHALVRNRPQRELEITAITPFYNCSDPNGITLIATVKNNGLGTDHNFDVNITTNGVPEPVSPYQVSIAPDASVDVYLFVPTGQIGLNNVTVDLSNIDGQGEDENPANDVISTSFTIDPNSFQVQLYFTTNDAPQEDRWELRDGQNNLVASGGPYAQAFFTYSAQFCLPKDSCFVFHVFDTGNNGMDGGFINLNTAVGVSLWNYSGGNFGAEIQAPFCAVDLCGTLTIGYTTVNASGQGNADGSITAVSNGGTPPYLYSLNFGTAQSDPTFGGLLPGLYSIQCYDANGCFASSEVSLGTVATQEPQQIRRLKVSPNPTTGLATIELPALDGEQYLNCEVLDSRGELIEIARLVRWDNTLRGMAILDRAPAGIYFLRVKGLPKPLTARLVKQ